MQHPLTTKKKSWFYSSWVACILIVFVVWGAVSVVRAYDKQHEAITMRNQAQDQINDLNQKQADLTNQIQDLSTDRGVEAEVRERYRVVKPGEQLVIVVDNSPDSNVAPKETFWQKVREFVGF